MLDFPKTYVFYVINIYFPVINGCPYEVRDSNSFFFFPKLRINWFLDAKVRDKTGLGVWSYTAF